MITSTLIDAHYRLFESFQAILGTPGLLMALDASEGHEIHVGEDNKREAPPLIYDFENQVFKILNSNKTLKVSKQNLLGLFTSLPLGDDNISQEMFCFLCRGIEFLPVSENLDLLGNPLGAVTIKKTPEGFYKYRVQDQYSVEYTFKIEALMFGVRYLEVVARRPASNRKDLAYITFSGKQIQFHLCDNMYRTIQYKEGLWKSSGWLEANANKFKHSNKFLENEHPDLVTATTWVLDDLEKMQS